MVDTQRTELYKKLPLKTPFSLHIFASFYCNFRCSYCLHSLSKEQLDQMHFKKQMMEMDVYKKAVDDLDDFDGRLKALIFAGHGEPLLNPHIAEMVVYAKKKNVADRVEIVTNGSLLTHDMSDALIDAGLDRLRVSVQGLSSEKYKEISDVDLDVDELRSNLEYFCQHKKDTEVYAKIMDIDLEQAGDENKFKDMFRNACDVSAVEYTIPFVKEIDYSEVGELSGRDKQGNTEHSNICSMPFYMMVLYPDGSVTPCCSTEVPIAYGNVLQDSLKDIWESSTRRDFLIKQLKGYKGIDVCKSCSVPDYGLQEGDYLDGHEDELIRKYELM